MASARTNCSARGGAQDVNEAAMTAKKMTESFDDIEVICLL